MKPDSFFKIYFDSYKTLDFVFKKFTKDSFINSVINYFNLETNLQVVNDADHSKRASYKKLNQSLGNIIQNEYSYIPKANHYGMK